MSTAHDTHSHGNGHHRHDHTHDHGHKHVHPHGHHAHADHDHPAPIQPTILAPAPTALGSLLLLSAAERLVMAVAVLAALWGATLWVLA